jgi:glycine hydroxymethyltransferase
MKQIAHEVGATLIVDMAHFAGLVAGGVFTGDFNPVHFGDIITSTTHKTLRGPRGGIVLCTNEYKEFVDKGCPMALGGPLPHVLAAKAVAFEEAQTPDFARYAAKVVENARVLAEILLSLGVPVITGGTDNHMVVFSVTKWGLTGRHAENALRNCHITVNRNAVPFDTNGPWYTSGVRIGTAALTTLGMGNDEMKLIAHLIVDCLKQTKPVVTSTGAVSKSNAVVDSSTASSIQKDVAAILQKYPLYPELDLNCGSRVESCVLSNV